MTGTENENAAKLCNQIRKTKSLGMQVDEPEGLLKAILAAVDHEERCEGEYCASTKYLIEHLSDYDADQVGSTIARLVDGECLLQGRDYPPREGETFKFYIHLTLTMSGRDRLMELTMSREPVQRDLFD